MKRVTVLISILLGCFLVGFSETDSEPIVTTQDITDPPHEDCVVVGKSWSPECPGDQTGCAPTAVSWHCPKTLGQGCSVYSAGLY